MIPRPASRRAIPAPPHRLAPVEDADWHAGSDADDHFRLIVDRSADAIVVVDAAGHVRFANPAAEALFQRGRLAGTEFGLPLPVARTEVDIVRPDGPRVAEMRVTDIEWNGEPARLAILRDISRRKETERELLLAGRVFDNATEGLAITDAEGRVLKANAALAAITGVEVGAVAGTRLADLLGDAEGDGVLAEAAGALEEAGRWEGEVVRRRPDGEAFAVWVTLLAVTEEAGSPGNRIAILSDITAWRRAQERLDHLAHYDPLTDLPNRASFQEALERACRQGGGVAILFVDLDGFKAVNDELGHAAGDALLREAGQRLQTRLRSEDLVARLGGDEFIVLLEEADAAAAGRVAEKLTAALEAPFRISGEERRISASIGIALAPHDGQEPEALIRAADGAMYRAKAAGAGTWHLAHGGVDRRH